VRLPTVSFAQGTVKNLREADYWSAISEKLGEGWYGLRRE